MRRDKPSKSAIQLGSDIIFTTSPLPHQIQCPGSCGSPQRDYPELLPEQFLPLASAPTTAECTKPNSSWAPSPPPCPTTDHIGYLADYPIYGTIANINAFAMGAKMINPRAMIHLEWSRINHWSGRHALRRWRRFSVISGPGYDPPRRSFPGVRYLRKKTKRRHREHRLSDVALG